MTTTQSDRVEHLKDKALEMRKRLLRLTHEAGPIHIGGDLSMTDILTVVFEDLMNIDPLRPDWPERDRFILSKGHGGAALYISMANRGFFNVEEIYQTYGKLGTRFGMHPCRNHLPGVETSTGSLGHGLSIIVGMGLAARLDGRKNRVISLMGDGELNEGSVWEAVMAAAHYKLGNLVAFIDKNDLSMDGRLDDIMKMNPIGDKFAAFGWNVVEVDGHDMAALVDVIDNLPGVDSLKPTVVVASTVKGKGVNFMEHSVAWHAGAIDAKTLESAVAEVEEARERDRQGVKN